jgi:hypothetical protein
VSIQPYTGKRVRHSANGKSYEVPLFPATVYTCFGADSEPLYVGCTGQQYVRFAGHASKPWWTDVQRIEVEHFEDKSDGLHRERQLIGRLRPRYNVAGKPEKVAA